MQRMVSPSAAFLRSKIPSFFGLFFWRENPAKEGFAGLFRIYSLGCNGFRLGHLFMKAMAILLLLSTVTTSSAVDSYVDVPTTKASELARKYVIADDDAKQKALDKLFLLAQENPRSINVMRIYASLLTWRGEYNKAIVLLESFNRRYENHPLMLQVCMLKDRLGDYDSLCYGNVISLMRAKNVNDVDYLMALFLTNDSNFEKARDRYVKSTGNKQVLDIFNGKRDALLKQLYPN